MPDKKIKKPFIPFALAVSLVVILLLTAGCTPKAVVPDKAVQTQPTTAVQVEAAAATLVVEATATEAPQTAAAAVAVATDTLAAAAAQPPAATATKAAPAAPAAAAATATLVAATPAGTAEPDKSFNAWCLPLDASVGQARDPLKPPANAKLARLTTDSMVIRNLPSNGCIFLYSFPQNASADLQLEVSEANSPSPFFKTKLQPVAGRSDVVYALVRHAMIIAPPSESVTYTFALRDPLGQVLRKDQVKLYAFVPAASGGNSSDDEGDSGGEDCGCTVPLP
jgi:hypothetical protein